MNIIKSDIDDGKAFDWGRTSDDYAKFRDIYPQIFYDKILSRGLCKDGQLVLDLGTGTGVIPRNMYRYGAKWIGTDISENQIEQAKLLSQKANMDIKFYSIPTEDVNYPDNYFDVITACQCFWYFDHKNVIPNLARMLKPNGKLLILYMAWLPYEDEIAGSSEKVVLKYNPNWSGAGETRKPIWIPDITNDFFDLVEHEEYDLDVHFTKESWHGRMKACRGVGASLLENELIAWDKEHRELLDKIAPNEFDIKHYAALALLKKK